MDAPEIAFEILRELKFAYLKLNTDQQIVDCNKEVSNILGIPKKVLLMHSIWEQDVELKDEQGKSFSPQYNPFNASHSKNSEKQRIEIIQRNKTVWASLHVIRTINNSRIVILKDITLEITQERELQHQFKLERIVTEISTQFTSASKENVNLLINDALKKIGQLSEVDRSYVFIYSDDRSTMTNTHEWCNEGVNAEIENLRDLPVGIFPWWVKKLGKNQVIHFHDINKMPKAASAEKNILETQDIQSIMVVPINSEGKVIGFMGFDSVQTKKRWSESNIRLLRLVSEIFGKALKNIELNEKIQKYNEELEVLVKKRTDEINELAQLNKAIIDATGAIIFTTDNKGLLLTLNPQAEKILEYSENEVSGIVKLPQLFADYEVERKRNQFHTRDGSASEDEFEVIEKCMAAQTPNPIECYFKSKNNKSIPLLLNLSAVKTSENQIIQYVGIAIDISEQKKLEAKQRKNERINEAVLNTVPDILFRINKKGEFLSVYAHFEENLILPKDQIVGKSIQEILPKEVYRESALALKKAFKEKEVITYEFSLQHLGSNKYYENRMIAISETEALSIIRDITIEKRASNKLQTTSSQLSTLVDTMQVGILFENTQREVMMANPYFCKLFKIPVSPAQIIGSSCVLASQQASELMIDQKGFLTRIEECMSNELAVLNDQLHLKDGRVFERDYVPVRNNKTLIGHLWQYREITERLKADEKLRNSETRLQFALESSGDGIWDWNAKTDEVYFSTQWKNMLGYEEKEIENTLNSWKSRVHPEDIEKVMDDLNDHVSGKTQSYSNEHRMLCKDGSYKWILDRGKIISYSKDGKPLRLIGTQADISKRKDYEASILEALKKEKELNELKSRFVSMTSHEFRTPLSTILAAAETLDSYMEKLSVEERKNKLLKIKSNVDFLRRVIDKVLNLSKIESGQIRFNPVKTDLNVIVCETIENFAKNSYQKRKINIVSSEKNLFARIDVQMIEQVIINLVGNAVKYSEENKNIDVKILRAASDIEVHISDYGIGIPSDDMNKIMDPFHRGTNVGNIHGTGLGLALSNQFILYHKGKITVNSKENIGTTFIVSLPAFE